MGINNDRIDDWNRIVNGFNRDRGRKYKAAGKVKEVRNKTSQLAPNLTP